MKSHNHWLIFDDENVEMIDESGFRLSSDPHRSIPATQITDTSSFMRALLMTTKIKGRRISLVLASLSRNRR